MRKRLSLTPGKTRFLPEQTRFRPKRKKCLSGLTLFLLVLTLSLPEPLPAAIAEESETVEYGPAEESEAMEDDPAEGTEEDESVLPDDFVFPVMEYENFTHKTSRIYDSETLKYRIETFKVKGCRCYLVKLWLQDPGKQIRKATADWKKNIQFPAAMAKQIPEAVLAINGSGYVSPKYPWIPEDYPGTSKDYYYTPLGSLTVTDGEIFRNLEGIPYSGLTLETDGLHMYAGEDNETVLAAEPEQTWSFYDQCPMQRNGEVLTPKNWSFARKRARRTVIGRVDRNNYLILSVTEEGQGGLTLHEVNDFFRKHFEVEWLYNLDGGPSTALLARKQGRKKLSTVAGGKAKDADIMVFIELPE